MAGERMARVPDPESGTAWDESRAAAHPAANRMRHVTDLTPKEQKKALVKALLGLPPVRRCIDLGKASPLSRRLLNKCLPGWIKYRGIFGSFEEARANAPRNVLLGYDHAEIAGIYKDYANFALSSDYPAFFWLRETLKQGSRIFDLGGNLGISFYAWEPYLRYPSDVEWIVCDLPSVIQEGQKLAALQAESRLRFTSTIEDASGCDFLLMSGCLQYIEPAISELLSRIEYLPRHLVINRTPLHSTRECVTLQNIKWMVSPYHIFQYDRFVAEVEAFGYSLVDVWLDAEHTCWIPFYPEYSLEAYTGLYFCRDR